jgi:regulator of nucleoside diphosphate kinase
MTKQSLPEIKMTRRDFARIDQLTAVQAPSHASRIVDVLVRELSRATVVEPTQLAPDVVTMLSQVMYRDEETGQKRIVTLVYPPASPIGDDSLSIMTPLGAALIGLSEGQSIEYERADGQMRRVTVVKVLFQPAADGRAAG